MKKLAVIFSFCAIAGACGVKKTGPAADSSLPYLGPHSVVSREENGKRIADTLYYTVPRFSLTNQYGKNITEKDMAGKVIVADFFFTTCPTICPVMKKEMLRVYEAFKENKQVAIFSHTIDPEHDTVEALREYASLLGVEGEQWNFLTGNYDSIYALADQYMVTALESPEEPGGFQHDGSFILLDQNRHIRGVYNGTDPKAVDRLMADIPKLLRE